jgi:hypothetical protein
MSTDTKFHINQSIEKVQAFLNGDVSFLNDYQPGNIYGEANPSYETVQVGKKLITKLVESFLENWIADIRCNGSGSLLILFVNSLLIEIDEAQELIVSGFSGGEVGIYSPDSLDDLIKKFFLPLGECK